jgi:hypothetical protein
VEYPDFTLIAEPSTSTADLLLVLEADAISIEPEIRSAFAVEISIGPVEDEPIVETTTDPEFPVTTVPETIVNCELCNKL